MFSRIIRYTVSTPAVYQLAGGSGVVYRALDTLHDRPVAIKTIGEGYLKVDHDHAIRAFRYECITQAKLHVLCDNIVAVYDFGLTDDDNLYYAMEWMEGGTADADCGRVTNLQAKAIIRQLITATEVAHQHGVVHGDIAPPNILCDHQRRTYKLSDFGVAKYMKDGIVSRILTPVFSSQRSDFLPREHLYDPARVNCSTDVFALAATYYTLLTGQVLPRQSDGLHIVPGVIRIQLDSQQGSPRLRRFFDRFITARRDSDAIDDFKREFEQLP